MNNQEVKQLKDIEQKMIEDNTLGIGEWDHIDHQIKLNNERITIVIGFILLCIVIF